MYRIFVILCLSFLFFGCSFFGNITKKNKVEPLLDNRQIEYNYSFTEATKQKIFGNYNQAINLFYRCSAINPNSAAVYYQLSDIFSITGDKSNALYFARLAVKLDKKNDWYMLNLAHVYQLNDKIDSTIYIYKKIVKANPNKYDYQFNFSLLYVRNNQFKTAIKLLKKLKKNYGFNKEIAVTLYKIYEIRNENKSAINILLDAIKKYPEEAHFYGLLAEHYASIGENKLALEYYDKLLNIDPENQKGILSLFEFYRNIPDYGKTSEITTKIINNDNFSKDIKIETLNTLLNDKSYLNSMKKEFKEILELMLAGNSSDVKVHGLYAEYYVKVDSLLRAKEEYLWNIKNLKINYEEWEKLSNVLISLEDYNTLFNLSEEAISNFHDKPGVYLFKGMAAFQLGKYDDALLALNYGLKYVNNSKITELQFFTFLGETYNAIKDFKNSDSFFQKALDIDKQNIFVLNNYSYYLAEREEKIDQALEYSRKCLEIQPNNYKYLDTYGWVLFKSKRYDEAKLVFEGAIAKGGSGNEEILVHYISVLIKLNLMDEALKNYRILKKIGKDNKEIRSLLKITD